MAREGHARGSGIPDLACRITVSTTILKDFLATFGSTAREETAKGHKGIELLTFMENWSPFTNDLDVRHGSSQASSKNFTHVRSGIIAFRSPLACDFT
jgi:hypothetical protein